ncbi:MAG: hypothetical protein AAFO02_15225 [Bacteroidota bacterium]
MKKILIVGAYFYPENTPRSFRTTELAKELAAQGNEVTVIVPKNAEVHDAFTAEHGFVIKDLGKISWKVPTPSGNVLKRLLLKVLARLGEQFLYLPKLQFLSLANKALNQESGYDLLISIASPHSIHWGVERQMRQRKQELAKFWVADCGDPFMLADNLQYRRPFYLKYLEKRFCATADAISIPFTGAKDGYYPAFRSKLVVIPQGFRFEDVEVSKQSLVKNDVLSFAYAGSLVPRRRDPRELLEYLLNQGVDFRFYIYAKRHKVVEDLAKQHPDKIILRNYVPRKDLLEHLSTLDFVVNFENVGTTQSPSKLIDYAILDKPIMAVRYGALQTDVVDEFCRQDYSNAYQVRDVDQYRIENVAAKFLELPG